MAKQEPISFTELVEKFNNEKACHDHLYKKLILDDYLFTSVTIASIKPVF